MVNMSIKKEIDVVILAMIPLIIFTLHEIRSRETNKNA